MFLLKIADRVVDLYEEELRVIETGDGSAYNENQSVPEILKEVGQKVRRVYKVHVY